MLGAPLPPRGVGYMKVTDDTTDVWRKAGEERDSEVMEGEEEGAEGERWSARSGSVSVYVSATVASSSSACHVGCTTFCLSVQTSA